MDARVRPASSALRSARALCPLLAVAGCNRVTVVSLEAERLEVVPPAAAVDVDRTTRLEARVLGGGGLLLAGRVVEWRSLDEAVAAVDDEGVVRGLSPGVATIRATSEGVSGTATVTVGSAPEISLSTSAVELEMRRGETDPVRRSVGVTNPGGGALTDLAVSIRYTSGNREGWLSARLASTRAPTTVALTVSAGDLPVGTQVAAVDVASPRARVSPVTLTVTVRVLPRGQGEAPRGG